MKRPARRNFEKSPIRVFASYFRPYKKRFAADLLCASLIAGVDLAFPMMTKFTLEKLLPNRMYRLFFGMTGLMILLYALRMGFSYFVTYWGHSLGAYIEADMRRDLFHRLQELPFAFYDNHRTGRLMSRVTNDLFEVTELAHHGPEDLFISVLTLLGSFILILTFRWEMALALGALLPLLVVHTALSRKKMLGASGRVKERTAEINASLESSISGIRVAQAFTNEPYEAKQFTQGNEHFKSAKRHYYKVMALFHSRIELMTQGLNVVVIALGGWLILRDRMSLAELIACSLFTAAFLQPIRRLQNFVDQCSTGMAGFKRFVAIMRIEPAIADRPGAIDLEGVQGNIVYRDVSFSYPRDAAQDGPPGETASPEQAADRNVLNHISLVIPAGSTAALVGPSGGGKTTLCHLLPRFYDIQEGSITIDGKDIRDCALASLRRNIGIVPQEVFLFAGSIADNIAYGRVGASGPEIAAAAERAELHEDIMGMPQGYATLVGERGVKLSGGQKQRVSIARIFLKDPPILILDEATSALDALTENKIQRALGELSRGRTTLIIAHRLSTIRNADTILVLDDEGIREQGGHEELLRRGGRYAELYSAQFSPGHGGGFS